MSKDHDVDIKPVIQDNLIFDNSDENSLIIHDLNNYNFIKNEDSYKKKNKKSKKNKELSEFTKDNNQVYEYIIDDKKYFSFCIDDKLIPIYVIRNFINTHQLSKAIKLFSAINEDPRSCPFFIFKTGNLLLKNYLETRPDESKEIFEKILSFNSFIKELPLYPTFEINMDFLIIGFELGYIDEIKYFIDSRKHINKKKVRAQQFSLCFETFDPFLKFHSFFRKLREENFNHKLYIKNESKKKELQHVILSLENLVIGFLSENCDYPLDYYLLCLIDILIIFEKKKKSKKVLFKYYKKHPNNLNIIIYILKFNELFLNDEKTFNFYYKKLEKLDPSNENLIFYLNHLDNNYKKLKILLNYVDYYQNKDNKDIWKNISESLDILNEEDKLKLKKLYNNKFESYWSNYHFSFKAIKINKENCDYIYNKAKIFLFFDKDKSSKYVKIISFILKSANSDKFILLNNIIMQKTGQN